MSSAVLAHDLAIAAHQARGDDVVFFDGRNAFVGRDGLSEDARKVIAGYLTCAASLTAFGNTVPTSYLRLVPHQEAPTSICWGDRNRSVLHELQGELASRTYRLTEVRILDLLIWSVSAAT